METTRTDRGAWRRGPLPGALAWARPAAADAEGPGPAPDPIAALAAASGADPASGASAAEEPPIREGGCLCGAVRFVVRGPPDVVGLCHCADCRKATGGTALHYADWPLASFALTGRLATHAGRSFCPTCGGRVVHLSDERAEVNLGALDDPPSDLVPTREGWIIRREPWMAPVPDAAQFERDPG